MEQTTKKSNKKCIKCFLVFTEETKGYLFVQGQKFKSQQAATIGSFSNTLITLSAPVVPYFC